MKDYNEYIADGFIIVLLLLCLFFLVFPWGVPVQNVPHTFRIITFIITFMAFSVFVWRAEPRDERERLHQLFAIRISYLLASWLLAVAIIIQSIQNSLDPWIPFILSLSIISRVIVVFYSRKRS